MNYFLLCGRQSRKHYSSIISKAKNTLLLGSDFILRNNTISKVLDDFNPHVAVIVFDTVCKDMALQDFIFLLRLRRASLRIIFVYDENSDRETQKQFADFLISQKIYDIVSAKAFPQVFESISEKQMSLVDYNKSLEDNENSQSVIKINSIADKAQTNVEIKPVALNFERIGNFRYASEKIDVIIENYELSNSDNITIAVSSLLKSAGKTHTSLELAFYLGSLGKSVCLILQNSEDLLKYFSINSSEEFADGFSLGTVDIFPETKLEEVRTKYNYTVIDCDNVDILAFNAATVKLLLCPSAEWQLTCLTDYINSRAIQKKADINYCFFPITQNNFIKLNKQLTKSKCRAYRLHTSDWQDTKNSDIFLDILRHYTDIEPTKKKKLFGK